MSDDRSDTPLRDSADIQRLAYLYGRGVDARTPEEHDKYFDACLAADAEIVYEFGSWKGLDAHKRITAENMLKVFTFTHHLITNPIIDVQGDTARASYRC